MTTTPYPAAPVYFARRYEGGGVALLARVLGADGTPITQPTVSLLTLQVFDPSSSSPATPLTTLSLDIATCVYNSLQTGDPRWTADTAGFNFLAAVPASAFPAGTRTYRIEITFFPSSGDPFFLPVNVSCEPLYSQGL